MIVLAIFVLAVADGPHGYDLLLDYPPFAFHIGNSAYKDGHLPLAILCYRRGLRADPADERLLVALDFARSQVRPADAEVARRIAMPANVWPPWLALHRLGIYAFTLYAIGCVALTRWRMTRRRPWLIAGSLLLLVAAVPAVGSVLQWQDQRRDAATPVVVVTRDVELRAGNGVEYPAKLPLPRGGELRRLFVRGDWVQVEIADGTVGWLPADALVGL